MALIDVTFPIVWTLSQLAFSISLPSQLYTRLGSEKRNAIPKTPRMCCIHAMYTKTPEPNTWKQPSGQPSGSIRPCSSCGISASACSTDTSIFGSAAARPITAIRSRRSLPPLSAAPSFEAAALAGGAAATLLSDGDGSVVFGVRRVDSAGSASPDMIVRSGFGAGSVDAGGKGSVPTSTALLLSSSAGASTSIERSDEASPFDCDSIEVRVLSASKLSVDWPAPIAQAVVERRRASADGRRGGARSCERPMASHAAKRPRRDALSLDSLDLAALDAEAAAAMRTASELRTVAAADAARESTFPFLADESSPRYAAHAAAYAYSSLLWAEATLGGGADAAAAALRACDLALLRGGVDAWGAAAAPIVERAEALHAERAPYAFASASAAAANDDAARHRHEAQCAHFSRPTLAGTTIPRVDARSLTAERFAAEYMEASPPQPVVLTHALDAWPALTTRPWRDTGYLRWACGARLVPVETCAADDATQTYLSGSFAQRVMSLGDFIAQYFEAEGDDAADSGGDDARGYLAQHPLFDQVPALRRDIAAPFVCAARTAEDREAPDECERRDEPLASAWFGPGGTVSPLHNDPYHNALCQVLGWKYVRLYDARETPRLYRRPGALCNNSFVDLDAPDAEAHPRFAAAPYHQAVIGPGDCLYIPRHCWHYVRSLSPSFSVSFWWGARMALVDDADGVRSAY